MAPAGLAEPAVGVERPAQGGGGGQAVGRAVGGEHGKPQPGVPGRLGPQIAGQARGVAVHPLEGGPRQLGPCPRHCAAVDRLRLGPQAAAAGLAGERAGLPVDALAFAAGREGGQEREQHGKREFPPAAERLRRGLDVRGVERVGDQPGEGVKDG
jgi:hypothetical protein